MLDIDKGVNVFQRLLAKGGWFISLWGINAGMVGVCIFFVISGYLITTLMLKEEAQTSEVSLTAFYSRRICRILPPLLIYILVVHLLSVVGAIHIEKGEAVSASFFLCNTTFVTCGHHFNQLWSLAVEEQFYLIWPMLFIVTGRARTWLAASGVLIALAASVVPSLRIDGWLNNGLAFACISMGVLYALSGRTRQGFAWTRKVPSWILVPLLVFVLPFARTRWGSLDALIMLSLPFVIVATVVARPGHVVTWLQNIGLMSYSLYLWQGPLAWKSESYLSSWLPFASIIALPIAWVSYRYVEQPSIAAGRALQRLLGRTRLRAL